METQNTETKRESKYDAFISYRHAELDIYAAEHLHKLLENFRVPRLADQELKKSQKRRINRVFRDKDELPASDNLAEPIEEALKDSQFLIVVCSPRTPESRWVSKEIEQFAKYRGRENILAVLIEGEPYESFPKIMCHGERQITREDGTQETEQYEIEPLAADVRGNSKSDVYRNLKHEVLRLAAPILHCSYDDLKQRHKEQKLKRMLSIAGVIATALFLFGCFATAQNLRIRGLQSESLAVQAAEAYKDGDRQQGIELASQALASRYTTQAQTELTDILQIYENGENYLPETVCRHDIQAVGMAANDDCSLIAVIDKANQIYLWDGRDGSLLYQGTALFDQVIPETLIFLDEHRFIYGGAGGIAEFDTQEMNSRIVVEDFYATSVSLSNHHDYLLATDRYELLMYDTVTWEQKDRRFADETGSYSVIGALQVTDDGRYYSFGMTDLSTSSLYTVVDTTKGDILYQNQLPYDWVEFARLEDDGSSYVLSKDFASNGSFMMVGDEQLLHYDQTGKTKWNYEGSMLVRLPMEHLQEDIIFASNCDLIFVNSDTGKEHLRIGYSSTIKNFSIYENYIDCYLKGGTVFRAEPKDDHYETSQILDSAVKDAAEYACGSNLIAIRPADDICIYLYQKASVPADGYEPLSSYVSGIVENADGNRILAYGLACNEMILYDTDDVAHKAVHIPYENNEIIGLITQTADGRNFVVITNNHIRVYRWEDGGLLQETVVDEFITQQAVSGDGKVLCIQAFDTFYTMSLAADSAWELSPVNLQGQLFDQFCLNSDGTQIVGRDADRNGLCYHLEDGTADTLAWTSSHLQYNGAAKRYLTANENNSCMEIYDEQNHLVSSIETDIPMIQNIGFSQDGSCLYIQKLDGTLEIYQTDGLKLIRILTDVGTSIGRMEPVTGQGWAFYSDEAYGDTGYLCNEKFEVTARIPKLFCISADGNRVYTANTNQVLLNKLWTLKDIRNLAESSLRQ
ncbi:MAG: toll/interleukin-1 receptor domain-containing protein [bacterium]|nr:toll/interleukin-1 receptor domain-containing protein [bacterium]